MVQAGDPTATGGGGTAVSGLLGGARFFASEPHIALSHNTPGRARGGVLSTAPMGQVVAARGDDELRAEPRRV